MMDEIRPIETNTVKNFCHVNEKCSADLFMELCGIITSLLLTTIFMYLWPLVSTRADAPESAAVRISRRAIFFLSVIYFNDLVARLLENVQIQDNFYVITASVSILSSFLHFYVVHLVYGQL
ncbi:hypothetical protein MPTK1_5g11350 [Marchantia polymorpha subsp. ruderalis]|uniref:Uncharacterized protein n=2 Tax=Marchantia polymorpha TaxID=3197 RepID=A0AAF6BH89_MARPO|nr:hypothetical protein MARPO_0093s0058 [Marchantia polymorpha]BBN11373.1 hypothetical protein Mp_5g11350 [Marchantia polymorpha subsp. ruderalis]|eukprot:PTQ32985.1 hypothetical protein MARPO_0093s0058 [Marchantia polymorpha]